MKLKLYNSLIRSKTEFKPVQPGEVGLYTCGPTVYNFAHIGNLRTYLFEDILKRVLQFNGYRVKHVMNITDVGHLLDDADEGADKLEEEARRQKKEPLEIAQIYIDSFMKANEIADKTYFAIYQDTTNGMFISNGIEFKEELKTSPYVECMTCLISFSCKPQIGHQIPVSFR